MAITFTPLTLSSLTNPVSAVNTINANFIALQTALIQALSLNNQTPNSMNAALNMNSQQINNLGAPINPNDAARLYDVNAALGALTGLGALAALQQIVSNPSGVGVAGHVVTFLNNNTVQDSGIPLANVGNSSVIVNGGYVVNFTVPSNITLTATGSGTLATYPATNANLATMAAGTIKSNITGAAATPSDNSLSAILDSVFGTAQGTIAYRGSSSWTALAAGTAGYVLQTNGAAAPSWVAPSTGGIHFVTRQTVVTAPGSWIPSSSGVLTLTTSYISGSYPLIVTAAQGFNSTGPTDNAWQFSSNISWTCAASQTLGFLFINANTGATSVSSLVPIYQFGGTISVTNGQFTFDTQAMKGYLGNGTTAVLTPLVCVGEYVSGATTITSTVTYAINGRYEGSTSTLYTSSSFAHNIGVPSQYYRSTFYLVNTITNASFAVGDALELNNAMSYMSSGGGVSMQGSNAGRYSSYYNTTSSGVQVIPENGGSFTAINTSDWKIYLVVIRNF